MVSEILACVIIIVIIIMRMRDLPDTNTQSLMTTGPRAEGIHIRQITSRVHMLQVICITFETWEN